MDGENEPTKVVQKRDSTNKDKARLKLIYVTGKTHEFFLPLETTAAQISKHVFENWPEDWAEDKVDRHQILRLIYQGRFLHGEVTLAAVKVQAGKLTVMHLVPREKLPEANSQNETDREKSEERRCMRCCWIL